MSQDVDAHFIMKPASLVSDDVRFAPIKRKLDDAFLAMQHAPSLTGSKPDDDVDVET